MICKCRICGNVVRVIHTGGGTLSCCGQPIKEPVEDDWPLPEVLDIQTHTIWEGRQWLRPRLKHGTDCPLCQQRAQVYKRKLSSGMAWGLIMFYRHVDGDTDKWLHVPSSTDLSRLGGDWAKLKRWGLIEARGDVRDDGGKHSGWWRITEDGIAFVRGILSVPSHFTEYNGRVLRLVEDKVTTIQKSLGSKFSYDELMSMPISDEETEGAI